MKYHNPSSRLQYPFVWLLTVSMLLGPLSALRQGGEPLYWNVATGVVAIAAAWGVLTTRFLASLPAWQRNSLRYRAAEAIVIAVLLRLLLWLMDGFPPADAWRDILIAPLSILELRWWGYLIFALWAWNWANILTALLGAIGISERELRYFNQPTREQRYSPNESPLRRYRSRLAEDFARIWLYGGLILIVCSGFATFQLSGLRGARWFNDLARLPLPAGLLWALLLYLFVGLWLMSYIRYTVMYARWMGNGATPDAKVAGRWRRDTLLLLSTVAVVAAFLPIGSSVPISRVLQYLLWLGYVGLLLIMQGFFFLLAALLSLFRSEEQAERVFEPPPPLTFERFSDGLAPERTPLPAELTGGLTWLLIVTIVVAAVLFLLRQRGHTLSSPRLKELWAQLLAWWRGIRQNVDSRLTQIRSELSLRRRSEPDVARPRYIRINKLPPRAQVRYFYLSTLRRAGEQGVARQPAQTPAEYLDDLQQNWPAAAEDSEELTTAFLHARYSRDPIEDAGPIKQTWRRVRRSLRGKVDE